MFLVDEMKGSFKIFERPINSWVFLSQG